MMLTAYFFCRVLGAIGAEASLTLLEWIGRKMAPQRAKLPSLNLP